MGPSAAGKTELALRLADTLPAVDLISVDSAMVYRGFDVGTAKPAPHLLRRYPHALVDIKDPTEPYSVADFLVDAKAKVQAARELGRIPVLVGGSMLYFKALRDGLSSLPSACARMRAEITALADAAGWPAVHAALAEVDPEAAARLSPNDAQRVQRALEVYRITGRTLGSWWRSADLLSGVDGPILTFALAPKERAVLHARIAERFHAMLAQGLVAEIRRLRANPALHGALPALRAVGYRQVWACLEGELDWSELEARTLAATRQIAKRQLSWLRRWYELTWLPEKIEAALTVILRHIKIDEPLPDARSLKQSDSFGL